MSEESTTEFGMGASDKEVVQNRKDSFEKRRAEIFGKGQGTQPPESNQGSQPKKVDNDNEGIRSKFGGGGSGIGGRLNR